MAVSEMLKLRVISHKSVKDEIVDSLLRMGIVEFVDLPSVLSEKIQDLSLYREGDGKAISEVETFLNDLRLAIDFLESANENKRGLIDSLLGERICVSRVELEEKVKRVSYKNIVEEIRGIERKLADLKIRKAQLLSDRDLLESWKELDIPLEFFEEGTLKTAGLIGSLKLEEFERFSKDLGENLSLWQMFPLPSSPGERAFALVYLKEEAEKLQAILRGYGFNAFTVPKRKGTPKEAIKDIEEDILELERERESILARLKEYLVFLNDMKIIYDYISIALAKQKATSNFLATSKAFMFEGWVRKKDREKVEGLFSRYEGLIAYSFEEPSFQDDVPVVVENHPVIRPFEVLTSLYGLPLYGKDIDPTPYLAPFFFVFFGMCLSDAGYGLVMTLLITWFLLKYGVRMSFSVKRFLSLLLLGSISTIIFGALQGTWFDGLFDQVSWLKPLGSVLNKVKLIDPLEDPMRFLGISLALGIIHIFLGVVLKAYVNIKQGNLKDAIYDQIGWLWFLSSLLFFGGVNAGWIYISLYRFSQVMVLLSAVFLILTQGRGEKNPLKRVVKGVLSLYGVTGYLSDVLSYSRILALSLGSAVIAMIVNMLAKMVSNVPIVGIIVALVILIVGHSLSLLVNALGAFVHSTRLQYVEFFSKFYSGGGKAFEPFAIKTRFTDIVD